MGKLSKPRAADQIRPATIDRFGGVDRRIGARDGAIRDMRNMWGGGYPCAESRPRMKQLNLPNDYGFDNAFTVVENVLYDVRLTTDQSGQWAYLYKTDLAVNGSRVQVGSWERDREVISGGSAIQFAYVGIYLCIFPDMMIYDTVNGELRRMKWSRTVTQAAAGGVMHTVELLTSHAFLDYKIVTDGAIRFDEGGGPVDKYHWDAEPGDVVTVSGLIKGSRAVDVTLTVRAVERNEGYIVIGFDDRSLELYSAPANDSNVVVERNPGTPFVKDAVEVNGRLWGYYENNVYSCALNDPRNWEKFEGISTDSWNTEAPGEGEVTGVCEWNGAPVFFKETGIIRIYGSAPDEFTSHMTKCAGMRSGSGRTAAVCGGAIYYNSTQGIARWAGSVPVIVSDELGQGEFHVAAAISDTRRYYASLSDGSRYDLWVYDPERGTWHRYAEGTFSRFCYDGRLWGRRETESTPRSIAQAILVISGDTGAIDSVWLTDEAAFGTRLEFADFEGSYGSYQSRSYYGRKGVSRVDLRMTLDAGVSAEVFIRYDGGSWEKIGDFAASGAVKRTVRLPVIVRRCDHFAPKIETTGGHWVLHALTVFKYQGTDLH